MTASPDIDKGDASAAARHTRRSQVALGEDWVVPTSLVEAELRESRAKRNIVSLNRSPLARKIITFNLLALVILVAGVLYLNPFRDSLVLQRERGLVGEARLVAAVVEARLPDGTALDAALASELANGLVLSPSVEVALFGTDGTQLASARGTVADIVVTDRTDEGATVITDLLNALWRVISSFTAQDDAGPSTTAPDFTGALLPDVLAGITRAYNGRDTGGAHQFAVGAPVMQDGIVRGAIVLTTASGEIDRLVQREREQVLQMFFVALLVSIGLSLVLASTIANPLSDLAAAAELGRDRNARKMSPGRVRIPDLTARPDEIGRLSGALRGMVSALYERIDANEQFAADVAHEIKNPLASLRAATGTLRKATREDQRARLLDVIEHDVRRLDRLVSDISNASRLDSELVREEEETFDLLKMLSNLIDYHRQEAEEQGIDFISDLPGKPIMIQGLEPRLAQVFVNLLSNAISFCEAGDAVRLWVRQRDNRVLVVVEDTGPGIPESALTKIFTRFYSERPEKQFGNHSGLGLAISKQIVEAHGGVIWAENILPTRADATSDPLGARFVVGLPV
jgi:two-component system sensor histidine kinase ChvG